jgi:repressor LexA
LTFAITFAYAARMAITRRQRELYDFISRFVAEKQYSPSFEEIKEGMGLSSLATVHKHVTNLEKKGLLTRDYNRSRSIDLLPPRGKVEAVDGGEYGHGAAPGRQDCCGASD